MRWPLRFQILVPLCGLMLATLLSVSILNAWLAARRTKRQIETQLQNVAATLAESTFPLGDNVLRQTSGLSGAQFIVTAHDGSVAGRSNESFTQPPPDVVVQDWRQLKLDDVISVAGERYFYTAVRLDRPRGRGSELLHIYYPEQSWVDTRNEAMLTPLLIGVGVLAIAIVFSIALAGRVTKPIAHLKQHVERIARGQFQALPISRRNDEIRDLGESINELARMLARYEDQIRQSERLKTLGQLGGGIAHQMRNAATGCRLALEIHRRDCPLPADREDLDVAARQLTLMEKHLQRFLRLGQQSPPRHSQVDLAALIDGVLPLVRPSAEHIGVSLAAQRPDRQLCIVGDPDALEQMLINLLLNAIEATAAARGHVVVRAEADGPSACLIVEDSGAGPDAALGDDIFAPLVTTKPDGVGLGLSVARDIVEQHRGQLAWERRDGTTRFVARFPEHQVEQSDGAVVGH